jgi:protein involved in polysaccharide export with SLBB domain/capsular polysaccharide biosynthesis protein
MSAPSEFSLSAIQRKRGATSVIPQLGAAAPRGGAVTTALVVDEVTVASLESQPAKAGFALPFDPLRVIDAIYRRRWLILLVGLVVGGLLATAGWKRFKTHHVAVAQLIKQEPPNALRQSESGDPYQPHELPIPTLLALMRGSALMERTVARLGGEVSEGVIKAGLVITPERNTDIVRVSMTSDLHSEAAFANLKAYVEEVLTLTREIQKADAAEMNQFLKAQAQRADEALIKVNEELLAYGKREQLVDADKQMDAYLGELASFNLKYETIRLDHETLDLKIAGLEKELSKVSPAAAKLQTAREELAALQLRYTEEHPTLMEAMDRVTAMELTLAEDKPRLDAPPKPGESTVGESLYLDLIKLRSEKQVLGEQLEKMVAVRTLLNAKLELLPRKALEYAQIKARKQALEVGRSLMVARQREAELQEEHARGSYRLLAMGRPQDVWVERPTKKIAMFGVGGFAGTASGLALLFGLIAVRDTRVRTVADLKRSTGLPVLGALNGDSGEDAKSWAFQTWTKLQPRLLLPASGGATVCGLLTANAEEGARIPLLLAGAAASRGQSVILVSAGGDAGATSARLSEVLKEPESVFHRLGENPQSVVHLQVEPDWTWTLPQRQQWQRAMSLWSQSRGTVVLVQLTAPEQAETLLVAERLTNLLWITESEHGLCEEARTVLSTYRAAGCRLVGALLDHAPTFRLGLLNKLVTTAACVLLAAPSLCQAEELVLGAGDAVNISAVGFPEYARNQVFIGPDGKLTYLQAQNIQAAGLTIDALRHQLMTELRTYYKNLILVVTPMTFQSRKVYVLGKVVKKGAINLDRPLTILETVAEAGGLETGLFQQNTVELADLGRSFLMRGNQRLPVDLEALFLRGDMTQNIEVKPDDYLYFPSANSNEIYVLGDVKMQGTQGLLAHTSVHSAVAQAGGFTPKAYTQRVLVIRGSLEQPEAIVVNMDDIMAAREKGFRLEPKDIVYIADKPWARAEELLGFAINAFLQGAVSGWAGANVGPLIKTTLLPGS